jgi:diguanylate cyclase (GGDEF)-like protein
MTSTATERPSAALLADARPSGWRGALLRMGRTRAVLLITAISVALSLLVTTIVSLASGRSSELAVDLSIATLVPLIVAPLASGAAFSLLAEVEAARRLLREAAIRDGLTNLYNRRFLAARIHDEVARARRESQPLSVIMIDIDHFKRINDLWGHAAGDEVLQRVADTLIWYVRPDDLSARFGGEEFVALLPGTDVAQAEEIAERIRAAIEKLHIPAFGAVPAPHVTASLGVARLESAPDDVDELLRRADDAMYEAKDLGRNRCVRAVVDATAERGASRDAW